MRAFVNQISKAQKFKFFLEIWGARRASRAQKKITKNPSFVIFTQRRATISGDNQAEWKPFIRNSDIYVAYVNFVPGADPLLLLSEI